MYVTQGVLRAIKYYHLNKTENGSFRLKIPITQLVSESMLNCTRMRKKN